ncbi:MAG: hypothetical protein KF855_05780 [Acidobacteria bacterium]|nr:hypothetical protein [Acidobacteriota bacterium]
MLKYPIFGSGSGESIRDTERDNLYIGWDDEDRFVILFTPSMKNTDIHYHVGLSVDEASRLMRYLEKKLFEIRKNKGDWARTKEILANAGDEEPVEEDRL